MSRARIWDRPQFRSLTAAQELWKIEKIAGADENVDLGKLLAKLGPITLREASCHYQPFARTVLFHFSGREDRVDRLLLGWLDESACVDQQHLRLLRVQSDLESLAHQCAQHQLAIGCVFRTSQADQMNAFHGRIK